MTFGEYYALPQYERERIDKMDLQDVLRYSHRQM